MVTTVNVHDAKTHFSKLLQRVAAGERIIIARAGKPVAEIVPFQETRRRVLGADRGLVLIGDDFDDPLPEFEEEM